MYEIDDLQIRKEGNGWRVVDELSDRTFTISSDLVPSPDWFCSYETIKRILSILNAEKELLSE